MEARLVTTNHVLVALSPLDLDFDFFGTTTTTDDLAHKTVYLAGDLANAHALDLRDARVFAIDELTYNHDGRFAVTTLGKVPARVGGGVYYRRFFDDASLFHRIRAEHAFQSLTESSKPSKAHRTGIYLTPVTQHGDDLHFRLLRCSTNLSGPTEDFGPTDRHIVDALNREAATLFADHAPLNHVLAQVYTNVPAPPGQKQVKAKISAHADKTKDMPSNGIMAFCTFYDRLDTLAPMGPFDHGYKGKSGLTRLAFRPKSPGLPAFALTLYPNSVFFMPLSTNRLYTHEIQSSMLGADLLPTRLGYVVRCSKTEAVHRDGTTFLKRGPDLVPMEPATDEGIAALRALYAEENKTDAFIDYGDRFLFSMNAGDYQAPRRG